MAASDVNSFPHCCHPTSLVCLLDLLNDLGCACHCSSNLSSSFFLDRRHPIACTLLYMDSGQLTPFEQLLPSSKLVICGLYKSLTTPVAIVGANPCDAHRRYSLYKSFEGLVGDLSLAVYLRVINHGSGNWAESMHHNIFCIVFIQGLVQWVEWTTLQR